MTQDSDRQSTFSSKRSARAGRNRPVLVTPQDGEGNELVSLEESSPTLEESRAEVEAQNAPVAAPKRRMPAFFSTVGKRMRTEVPQETPEMRETDQVQARIARATRNKTAVTKAASEAKKPEVKRESASSRSAAPGKPNSLFKTRYLIGMGLYLLAANFIGIFETQFLRAYHLEAVLTQFNLFGSKITISTSTLVFLGTLVIILVALARFDLIPRNFSAMMGGSASSQQNKRGSNASSNKNQSTADGGRNTSPSLKQGVKGANDNLYQEFRSKQRRTKKK
ncbi:MAG: hypothetical protein M3Y76_03530 [Chloroflexota bacterium]|nr:hypothetical protein [Chloroflexota bacterium]